ncbi:MAG: polysaccharide deacetylase family protein [Christensenellaceae bacterium]
MNFKKITALFITTAFLFPTIAACAKPTEKQVKSPQAYREEFVKVAQNRHFDEVEGVATKNILDTEGNTLISADYPVLAANEAVSMDVESFVNKNIEAFKAEAEETRNQAEDQEKLYSYALTYKPYMTSGGIFGVKFSQNSYTEKIDRKNYVDAFTYNLATSSKMALDDIFDPAQDYLTVVSTIAKEQLLKNEVLRKSMDEGMFEKGTSPSAQNYSNFVITSDKMIFFFNKNTIAPAQAGTIEASIPLELLDSVLNPANKTMIYGQPQPAASVAPNASAQPSPSAAATGAQTLPQQLIADDTYLQPGSIEGIDVFNDKVVAFTYDDGPSPNTPKILDILKENGAVATFFVVGNRVPEYSTILKRAYDEGNEIGAHSYDHSSNDLKWTIDQINEQISKANDEIQKVIGKRTLIDRPTEGAINEEVAEKIGRMQVIWDVDSRDWADRKKYTVDEKAQQIYDAVMPQISSGSVVLMHDLVYDATVQASARIIKELKEQGYKFVTATQMIQIAQARGQEMKYVFNGAKPANEKPAPSGTGQ